MRFIILLLPLFPLLLMARENPFTPPVSDTNIIPVIVNKSSSTESVAIKKRKPKIHPQRPMTPKNSTHRVVFNTLKARFVISERDIYIETKDLLKKHFSLQDPMRIVIDFKSPSDFASKRKSFSTLSVLKIEMGAPEQSYRNVFTLK